MLNYEDAPHKVSVSLTDEQLVELFADIAMVGPDYVMVVSELDIQTDLASMKRSSVRPIDEFLRVIQISGDANPFAVGDRVFVAPHAHPVFSWSRGKYDIAVFHTGQITVKVPSQDLFEKNEHYLTDPQWMKEDDPRGSMGNLGGAGPHNNFGMA